MHTFTIGPKREQESVAGLKREGANGSAENGLAVKVKACRLPSLPKTKRTL
jgi:hypothetical protein